MDTKTVGGEEVRVLTLPDGPSYVSDAGGLLKRFSEVEAKIDALTDKLASIKGPVRVSWETKVSDTGIQIANGPSTVTKYGTLVSSTLAPISANQMGLILIVLEDGGTWAIVEAGAAKVIQ